MPGLRAQKTGSLDCKAQAASLEVPSSGCEAIGCGLGVETGRVPFFFLSHLEPWFCFLNKFLVMKYNCPPALFFGTGQGWLVGPVHPCWALPSTLVQGQKRATGLRTLVTALLLFG